MLIHRNEELIPRIILVGDSGVGKTSIVNYQLMGANKGITVPTVGCHSVEVIVNLNDEQIKMSLWDTAGQELYRSLVPIYIKNASVALIVIDVTRHGSVESFNSWRKVLVDCAGDKLPIFIVANKVDLQEKVIVSDSVLDEISKSSGSKYVKTSARTGDGIEKLFIDVATEIERLKPKEEKIVINKLQESDNEKCC